MIHNNSIRTYYEEKPKLNKRAKLIYEYLLDLPPNCCHTDREIMMALGYSEPNQVRPRITELVKMGMLHEVGKTKCDITGKNVRLVSNRHSLQSSNNEA